MVNKVTKTDMKRLLTLLALVLCSCSEIFVGEEMARPTNENLPDLTAAFAEEGDTRTYIEDGKYLRWHEGDLISAFFGNTLNRQYRFNGATGDNSGTFSLVADGVLGTGNAFDRIYALYPYNSDARISDEGTISLTLPATQTYAENTFGAGANTMVAVTENLDDTFLSFKNACGYLKLRLYNADGATLKTLVINGNNGEKFAGEATISINYGQMPLLTLAESATQTITLDCGEGITLGTTAETATELWLVVPATTFAKGLTITATDSEGKVFEKSTTKEVVIERNVIQPMAALKAEFVTPKPANNEIWYTNGSTTTPTTLFYTSAFGVNIVSNTYNYAKRCWVLTFDGNVTKIGNNAFYQHYGQSITSITLPESVTSIGNYAFYECEGITSIHIPESVTSIGEFAFGGCSALNTFSGLWAEDNGRILAKNNTLIAFAPAGLTEYTIPNNITGIGFGAFAYCASLTNITIPDNVTSLGFYAFCRCTSLTNANIGNGITKIGESTFYKCTKLESITLGDNITEITSYAFQDCSSLASITLPNSLKKLGQGAFMSCRSLTNITIPGKVTSIGDYAFSTCSNLTTVEIPDGLTSIGYNAFEYCKSLTSVTIPDSTTKIGYCAFYNCSNLANASMGRGVSEIGDRAFASCPNLTNVECKATTPPTAGGYIFDEEVTGRRIYVPSTSLQKYQNGTYWWKYRNDYVGRYYN